MNRDQPLIHFYHKAFLPNHDDGEMEKPPAYVNEAKLTREGQIAEVNGVKIRFHRWATSGLFPRIQLSHRMERTEPFEFQVCLVVV